MKVVGSEDTFDSSDDPGLRALTPGVGEWLQGTIRLLCTLFLHVPGTFIWKRICSILVLTLL